MPRLKSLNLSIVVSWRFCCWYFTLRCDLDLWPCTFASYRLWRNGTLWRHCDFSVWPDDIEHCVTCCARLWYNFHPILTSYNFRAWIIAILMLIRYVALWPWHLTHCHWNLVYLKRHVIRLYTKFERNRAIPAELLIILLIISHVISLSDLDLWPLDLELLKHFGVLCLNYVHNWSEIE